MSDMPLEILQNAIIGNDRPFEDRMQNSDESNDESLFDIARKLTACSLILSGDCDNGEVAAAESDQTIFCKSVEYAVGMDEKQAEQAIEEIIDRSAATVSVALHSSTETAIRTGCRVAGTFIGGLFGPAGAVIGEMAGEVCGNLLNKNVSEVIDKGIQKVKEVAVDIGHKVVEGAKNILIGVASGAKKLFSKLFG